MCMHDMRAEFNHEGDKFENDNHILKGRNGTAQLWDKQGLYAERFRQVGHIAFMRFYLATHQQTLKLCGVKPLRQQRDVNGRPAYVEPSNNAQYSNRLLW